MMHAARLYLSWVGRRPLFAFLFAALMTMVWGLVGQDFGLRDLFWHENSANQALAGVSIAGLAMVLWLFGFALEEDQDWLTQGAGQVVRFFHRPGSGEILPEAYLAAMFLPLGIALWIPQAATYFAPTWAPKFAENGDCWALPVGAWITFALVEAALWFCWRPLAAGPEATGRWRRRHAALLAVLYVALPFGLFHGSSRSRDPLVAAYAIAVVLGTVAAASFLLTALADRVNYRRRLALATIFHAAALTLLCLLVGRQLGKEQYLLTLPGLEKLYDGPGIVHLDFPAMRSPNAVDLSDLWPAATPPFADRKPAEVLEALGRFLDENPDDLSILRQRGLLLWAKNDLAGALRDFESILRLDCDDQQALASRAKIYLARQDKDQAFGELNRLVLCHPESSFAFRSRGDSYASLGTEEGDAKALADYDEAIKLDPTSARAYLSRAVLKARSVGYDEASGDAEKASSLDPENPEIWSTLGRVLLIQGYGERAGPAFSNAIALASRAEDFYLRSLAWGVQGEARKARADLQQAIQIDGKVGKYYVGLGNTLIDDRELAHALEAFDKAILINSGDYNALFGKALAHVGMNEFKAAHLEFDLAIKADPGRTEAYEGKISAWLTEKKPREAIDYFLSNSIPPNLRALSGLIVKHAEALVGEGRHEEAIGKYGEALGGFPPRAYARRPILLKRGNSWLARGTQADRPDPSSIEKAIADYSEAIEGIGDPRSRSKYSSLLFPYYLQRARAFLAAGRYVEAVIDATTAASIGPSSQEPYLIRALGREKLHDAEGAREDRQVPGNPVKIQAFTENGPRWDAIFSEKPRSVALREPDDGLLDDLALLNRWRSGFGERKPKLVVVAASGGGIVAAYWTARCLCAIEDQYNAFPRHVRIVTGASGGMVGAGYYCATLTADGNDRTSDDRTGDDLSAVYTAVRADSLTPVVRRMVLGDLPGFFQAGRPDSDRGRVLEESWIANTGGPGSSPLARPFRELAEGERDGWRPSLIVSPTIVEEGRPMLISNLRLKGLSGGVELFGLMPEASKLTLATALRTNAAFPFVTPSVSLPTRPARHLVDAGYLDNYGVTLATDWIHRHRRWLKDHTSGVALVRIQAYPNPGEGARSNHPRGGTGPVLKDPDSGSFLIPLSAYSQAKLSITLDQHRARIEQLKNWFNGANGTARFFQDCPFVGNVEAPLSWTLASRDRAQLDKAIRDSKAAFHELRDFLQSQPADEAEEATP